MPAIHRMPKSLLIFMNAFWPGAEANGAVQSLLNLVDALKNDIEISIVGRDRPFGASSADKATGSETWSTQSGYRLLLADPDRLSIGYFRRLLRETPTDALMLNGFFDREFTIRLLVALKLSPSSRRPVVLAPGGEFAPAALRLRGPRKRTYIMATRAMGLLDNVWLEASTQREATDIRAALGNFDRIFVAPNIPAKETAFGERREKQVGATRLAFVGRISAMKNLDYALEVLARVSAPIVFEILGPVEDEALWRRCQALIAALPPHIKINVHGGASHDEVQRILRMSDALFLPTRGENFGYAIVEALLEGTPAVISDRTPWVGLEAEGCGFSLPLDRPEGFVAAIERVAGAGPDEWRLMSDAALAFGRRHFSREAAVDAARAMFATAHGAGA